MAKREDVEIELTVNVHFGGDHEPVTLVKDRKIPFVEAMLYLRKNFAVTLYGAVLRAAAMRPAVMSTIVPAASLVPRKAWQMVSRLSSKPASD